MKFILKEKVFAKDISLTEQHIQKNMVQNKRLGHLKKTSNNPRKKRMFISGGKNIYPELLKATFGIQA